MRNPNSKGSVFFLYKRYMIIVINLKLTIVKTMRNFAVVWRDIIEKIHMEIEFYNISITE